MKKMPSARNPWVAAALSDVKRLEADARRARRDGADLIEVRADAFPPFLLTAEGLAPVLARVRRAAGVPLLLTLRRRAEGGKLPRGFSEPRRLALITALLPSVDAVDVEGASSIAARAVRAARKAGRWTVVSHHDFKKTPADRVLAGWVSAARAMGGDVFKVAAMAKTAADVERLMALCAGGKGRRVFLPMGELGRRARRTAFRRGSCIAYGHVGRPTAPGQPSVKALRSFSA
jgi:3-dehydroquinate dehydratase-1